MGVQNLSQIQLQRSHKFYLFVGMNAASIQKLGSYRQYGVNDNLPFYQYFFEK